QLLALGVFIITIAAGFRGDQNPYKNLAPIKVWVTGWIGLAYVCAFVGNLWVVINHWRTIFEAVETIAAPITRQQELSLGLRYPTTLGAWPAFALLLAFSWIELVYPNPAVPRFIAWLLVDYSILTFAGMALFGRERWLAHGEVFSLLFGTLARFAPLEVRTGPRCE